MTMNFFSREATFPPSIMGHYNYHDLSSDLSVICPWFVRDSSSLWADHERETTIKTFEHSRFLSAGVCDWQDGTT